MISVLPYALWPLLTLAVVSLWIVAMVDIAGHRRGGSYTGTELSRAAAISVVAAIAVVCIGAVFAGQHQEVAAKTDPRSDGQREDARVRTFLFSFGLEHASYPQPVQPPNDGSVTGVEREQDRTSTYPEAQEALTNRP